jgi:hypothetical protein
MKSEHINHLENILEEIQVVQKQLFEANTRLMNLQQEVVKMASVQPIVINPARVNINSIGTVSSTGSLPPNDTW